MSEGSAARQTDSEERSDLVFIMFVGTNCSLIRTSQRAHPSDITENIKLLIHALCATFTPSRESYTVVSRLRTRWSCDSGLAPEYHHCWHSSPVVLTYGILMRMFVFC